MNYAVTESKLKIEEETNRTPALNLGKWMKKHLFDVRLFRDFSGSDDALQKISGSSENHI